MVFRKWVNVQPPTPIVSRQRLFVKINGKRDVIVFIIDAVRKTGRWCWSLSFNDSKGTRVSEDEFNEMEWLDEIIVESQTES